MTYTISNAKELQQEKFLTSYTTTSIIPQGAAWREVISERYVPSNIVIQMGSKVTWTNEDKFPHTITSGNRSNDYDHKFNSGIIALNHSYSYVFSAPGIYPYYCIIHPWMSGQIVVTSSNDQTRLFYVYHYFKKIEVTKIKL
ncbi:MAG: plastocyanin/azurin family copper-binding protein [Nitrososphaeraceae archaeon]